MAIIMVKLVLFTILLALPSTKSAVGARTPIILKSNLILRLRLDEESLNCWELIFSLQSCIGEVIMFSGETYLGLKRCQTIKVIEHDSGPICLALRTPWKRPMSEGLL
ncbi:hypothetical protein CRG98_012373 [Punica granatum]|nr:hypothetical protein CRG98_012373 [Punica granatum]